MPPAIASSLLTSSMVPYSTTDETLAAQLIDVLQGRSTEIDEGWAKVLDKFIEWGTHPEDFIEEGFAAPSIDTICLAYQEIVKPFRKSSVPPPQVVPDTHGGIVFERTDNGVFESIHVQCDGRIEKCRFSNGKLVDRQWSR